MRFGSRITLLKYWRRNAVENLEKKTKLDSSERWKKYTKTRVSFCLKIKWKKTLNSQHVVRENMEKKKIWFQWTVQGSFEDIRANEIKKCS